MGCWRYLTDANLTAPTQCVCALMFVYVFCTNKPLVNKVLCTNIPPSDGYGGYSWDIFFESNSVLYYIQLYVHFTW